MFCAHAQNAWLCTGAIQHESLFPTSKFVHYNNTYVDVAARYQHNDSNRLGFTGAAVVTRFELMHSPMLGYEPDFKGHGIGHLHADLSFRWGEITLGDIYGQFGSGLILRLYEERALGIDNALRGGKITLYPYRGIRLEMLGGKQRRYWEMYHDNAWGFNYRRDAVLGANAEVQISQYAPRMQEVGATWTIGGSYVSMYQHYNGDAISTIAPEGTPVQVRWNIPEWVGACDVRSSFQMNEWSALVEYAYKANDPSASNLIHRPDGTYYNYRPGQTLLASLSYSRSGLAVLMQAKRSENMFFRSDRSRIGTAGFINHLPAFTNQHTYTLAALYPYATQMAGEWAMQGELRYTFRRGTPMGGKYGTTFRLNGSHVRGLGDSFFSSGETYYTDVNLELNKKINKQWYIAAMLMYQTYNKTVVEGEGDLIRSGIGVADVKYAVNKNVQMRAELQYLFSRQDEGQWIFSLYELSLFSQFMLSAQIQHCIGGGTSSAETGKNYYSVLATWTKDAHRLALGYTQTRAGFNCSGGVCRYIPAQEGITASYSFTW